MKFALAILGVLVVTSPLYAYKVPAVGSGALAKELQDFVDLVPIDKIINLMKLYMAQDKEFQAAMKVLQSPELEQYMKDAESTPEAKKLMTYMENAGLDIRKIVNALSKAYGLGPVATMEESEYKIVGGLKGFVQEAEELVPRDKIIELFKSKMEKSEVFSGFIYEATKPENIKFFLNMRKNPHYVKLIAEAAKSGINTQDFQHYSPLLVMLRAISQHH